MTDKQETHLKRIIEAASEMLDVKFRAGSKEHPGDLRDMPLVFLLENALAENIDQFTYILTALDQAKGIVIPGKHTPSGQKMRGGIECWFCWHNYQKTECVTRVQPITKVEV